MADGFDIFDRTLYTTKNGRDLHRTMDETLEENCVYAIHAISWEGDYDACRVAYRSYGCNQLVEDDFIGAAFSGWERDIVIVNKIIRHKLAGRGIVTFTVKAFNRGYEGNVDFERVDRDIHCWRALCSTNKPILSQVKLWERNLEIDRQDLWEAYKYVGTNGFPTPITDDATKKLCEMIHDGVESYPEYYPVLNLTINFAKHPNSITDFRQQNEGFKVGGLLGKVVSNQDICPTGYSIPLGNDSDGSSPINDFEQLSGNYILCTADKLQMNGDGSYLLNRSFMKCRQIEPELYIGASGARFTPYDNPNN